MKMPNITDEIKKLLGNTKGPNSKMAWSICCHKRMRHPIAFHAKMMGDAMYLNQALQQPNAPHFVEAVEQEVNGHVNNNHWWLTKCSEVPPEVSVLPSVWSLKRKRDITTNEIKK